MGKYFTIDELCKTNTGLDNTPNDLEVCNIEELIEVLDDMRDEWGSGIRVNSGFRCKAVNEKVGGSETSAHPFGWAVDIEPVNGDMKKFQDFIVDYFKDRPFDQIIKEKPKNGIASWVHFGLRNSKGEQRKQVFTLI